MLLNIHSCSWLGSKVHCTLLRVARRTSSRLQTIATQSKSLHALASVPTMHTADFGFPSPSPLGTDRQNLCYLQELIVCVNLSLSVAQRLRILLLLLLLLLHLALAHG